MDLAPVLPVTVVIAAYNRAPELERALRSVDGQTQRAAQVIVVDDASTDGTRAVAEHFGADVVTLPENTGAAGARNRGIALAREPWVAFLDSDDEWLPDHLRTLMDHVGGHDAAASAAIRVGAGRLAGRWHGTVQTPGQVVATPDDILFPENPIPFSASMVRSDVLRLLRGFDESLRFSEDLDLWLRLVDVRSVRLIPRVTVLYHLHDGQKSGSRASAVSAQVRIVETCIGGSASLARTGERRATVVAWDDFRAELREKAYLRALGHLWQIVARPSRCGHLVEVVAYRREIRHLSSRWQEGQPQLG